MTTSTDSAAGRGLPEPELSLYGLSNHLRSTYNLMASLCLAISGVEGVYQRDALTELARQIEERVDAALECVQQHHAQQEART